MFWYLLNILIFTIAWLWPVGSMKNSIQVTVSSENLENRIRKKRVCITATITWIILSGLRAWSVGTDTLSYKINRFDKTLNMSWEDVFSNFYLKYVMDADIKDPAYTLVEKIFQIFSANYQLFLIFIAILFFVPLGIMIYKYSTNPHLSYVLFSCLFYSFFAITGHRQTIATAIVVFCGTELIRRRKLILFLLIVAISSMIHASAICFLPFYWISKIKITRISLGIYWGVIILSFPFRNQLLSLLQSIVGYEQYGDTGTASAGTFMFLLILLAIFITIFYRVILKKSKENMNAEQQSMLVFSINALMVACFFSPLLLINQSFMRVVQYYSIFMLFILPQCKLVFVKKDNILFETLCSGVMILLLISNQPVYHFFWQEISYL